jgi:hypothetical protein
MRISAHMVSIGRRSWRAARRCVHQGLEATLPAGESGFDGAVGAQGYGDAYQSLQLVGNVSNSAYEIDRKDATFSPRHQVQRGLEV